MKGTKNRCLIIFVIQYMFFHFNVKSQLVFKRLEIWQHIMNLTTINVKFQVKNSKSKPLFTEVNISETNILKYNINFRLKDFEVSGIPQGCLLYVCTAKKGESPTLRNRYRRNTLCYQ